MDSNTIVLQTKVYVPSEVAKPLDFLASLFVENNKQMPLNKAHAKIRASRKFVKKNFWSYIEVEIRVLLNGEILFKGL